MTVEAFGSGGLRGWRGGASLRAIVCGVAAALALTLASLSPALADCTTDISGNVTCAASGGTQTTPVGTGSEDGISVNIQSGATIDVSGSAPATAVDLNNSNTVINNGTVIGGDGALGISVNNGNTVTNNGSVIVGNSATGINACCDNTIVNSGKITVGDDSYGIFATDRTTVTNTGTIAFGALGYGIVAYGDGGTPNATITNGGTIVGAGGIGIETLSNYNVVNSGTISINNGLGIQVDGGNTVTNSGVISAGPLGMGIQLNGFGDPTGNTVFNSGSIVAQTAIVGTYNNTVTNTGTLQGAILLVGFDNTLTNRGYMIGGDPASFPSPSGGLIGGTLINDPSGTIAIRVAPTFNDFYEADTITLNGGRLHIVVTPGLYGTTTVYSQTTTGVSPLQGCGCGTLTGTFDTVTSSSPFFLATPDYSTPGEVDVTLTRLGFGAVPGMTPNQSAVGSALESGYSPSLDPSSTSGQFYANLLATNSVTVLDQLSGAGTAAAQDASFSATGLFNNAMMQQGLAWLTGAPGGNSVTVGAPLGYAAAPRAKSKAGQDAFAAMQPRVAEPALWRAWAVGFGGTRSTDGDASLGTADQSTRTAGGAAGVDHQIGDLLLGVAAGGSTSHFSVPSLSTSGDINGGHVGAYAFKSFGAAYAAATLNYAHFTNKTERTISGVGATENANGSFDSDQLGGRFELGWRKHFDHVTLTPFAAVEPTALWQRSYTESSTIAGGGSGVLGLSYSAHTTTSLPTFLGAQVDTRYVLAGGQVLSPMARLSWVHEFKPDRQVEATFVSIPSTLFTVDGARAARDSVRLDTGVTLALNQSVALFANFNGELSSESQMASATGGAKVTW
jgi:uncharacterized protein with beta-barrel porin domain